MRGRLGLLTEFLFRYRSRYVLGAFFLVVVDALQLVVPRLLGRVTDDFRAGRLDNAALIRYVGLLVGIALLVAVGRYFWRMYIMGTARLIDYTLRNRFFAHLETLSASFFNDHKTGDLMAHATNDIHAVRHAFAQGIVLSVDALFLTVSTVAILVRTVDLRLVALGLAPLPFVALIVTYFSRLIHSRFRDVQEKFAALTDRVQENLAGIRVVKAFVQEQAEIDRFEEAARRVVDSNMRLVRIWGLFWPLVQFVAGLSFVVVLGYGGRLVILGDISLGDFVAFGGYLSMAIWPMMAIGWVVNTLQRGLASMDRLNVIFSTKPEVLDGRDVLPVQAITGDVEFRNLVFTYPGEREPALRNIDLKIPAGRTVGILGRTGSGKTTLVNLLLRLYNPGPGELLVDGVDINAVPLAVLRRDIGYVTQDSFLFSTTIRGNIGFAGDDLSDEAIEEAAEVAGVAGEVREFPQGFDTVVGERGVTLSGGQKQRVAIARAIIKDPRILILDDCFSAVDAETEDRILRALRGIMRQRTTILISHRISTLKEADEIVVLDKGRIVERGSHEALVAAGGMYARIYERQLLEEELVSAEET
ncbi:MAG: ABC transporter ATP-binding protein/permease [Firmicutes bacterium]|nr:ABC transporter ATP-binding protein/permease [Bacillota bacterium]MDH7494872.1 ABC transporter ATP-binding protein [Bacillota bacterium]